MLMDNRKGSVNYKVSGFVQMSGRISGNVSGCVSGRVHVVGVPVEMHHTSSLVCMCMYNLMLSTKVCVITCDGVSTSPHPGHCMEEIPLQWKEREGE